MEMEKGEGVRVLSDTWWFLFISFTTFVKRKYTKKKYFYYHPFQSTGQQKSFLILPKYWVHLNFSLFLYLYWSIKLKSNQ